MVVSEVREFRQIKDWLLFLDLVILVIEDFNQALSDEIHLLHITLVGNNDFTWSIDSAVHGDDQFVGEASLAFFEKVVERSFELFEHPGVLNEVSLHLRSDLLVELELFDDKVEIVQESLLNVLSNVVVKGWLNMERLVGLLDLLDPHVQ